MKQCPEHLRCGTYQRIRAAIRAAAEEMHEHDRERQPRKFLTGGVVVGVRLCLVCVITQAFVRAHDSPSTNADHAN